MEIQYIKQISITDYLQQQGYAPARVQGIHYWYYSPLRNERTPSFKSIQSATSGTTSARANMATSSTLYALYIVALSAKPSAF